VLNSPAMVAGFRSRLAAFGVDVADEVYKGALILSSDQGERSHRRIDNGHVCRSRLYEFKPTENEPRVSSATFNHKETNFGD